RHFGSDACVYRLTLTTGSFADYPMPLAVREKTDVAIRGWNAPPSTRIGPDDLGFAPVWHPSVAHPLRVRAEPHACFDRTISGPLPPMAAPVSVTGHLTKPNQVDVVPVSVKKGTALIVSVESAVFGLPVTPVVRVLDPAGKPVAKGEPKQLH